jgi:hypothetical protein
MISASLESAITSVLPPGAVGHSLRTLAHRVRAFSAALGRHGVGRYLNISILGLQAHKTLVRLLVEVMERPLRYAAEKFSVKSPKRSFHDPASRWLTS